jgi:hypothetical protein
MTRQHTSELYNWLDHLSRSEYESYKTPSLLEHSLTPLSSYLLDNPHLYYFLDFHTLSIYLYYTTLLYPQ